MPSPKLDQNKDHQPRHYSVGAIIKKDNKYLLIDRAIVPLGFASLAGHIDEGEEPLTALKREVEEESGLRITSYKLILEEEVENNICSRNINVHYWYVYECQVEGEIKHNERETKSIGWYTKEEIKILRLEPVWEYFFKKLGVLNS